MNNRELSNKIIPIIPREVSSVYLDANPKGSSLENTPDMAKLKNAPKTRKRNLVLVKQSFSRPPQKPNKKLQTALVLSKLQYVI